MFRRWDRITTVYSEWTDLPLEDHPEIDHTDPNSKIKGKTLFKRRESTGILSRLWENVCILMIILIIGTAIVYQKIQKPVGLRHSQNGNDVFLDTTESINTRRRLILSLTPEKMTPNVGVNAMQKTWLVEYLVGFTIIEALVIIILTLQPSLRVRKKEIIGWGILLYTLVCSLCGISPYWDQTKKITISTRSTYPISKFTGF